MHAATVQDQLQVNLSLSKETVWQREQVIVTLEVITNDTFARLDSDEFEQNGLTIIPSNQKGTETKNELKIVKQWTIFPFLAGDQVIALPRIRYRPNSGRPITLELPQKILSVLKLPIYVAPTMPVGKVELESKWENGSVISTNTLYEWNIIAKATRVAPQTLPAISKLLRSSESLNILPFKKSIETRGGVLNSVYRIPFKVSSLGSLALPDIKVQYFEPESGKLEKVVLKQPFVFVISPWLIWSIVIVLFIGFIFVILRVFPYLQMLISKHKIRKDALNALANARDYQEIRSALSLYTKAMGWGENITLDQIAFNIGVKQLKSDVESIIEKLRGSEFSSEGRDKLEIKKQASALHKLLEQLH